MPAYSNSIVVEIARGIRAFLSLKAGVTRGKVPGTESVASPEIQRLQHRVEEQRKLLEDQRRQLHQSRQHLDRKDRRIADLEKRLAGKTPRAKRPEGVTFDGVLLPPKHLRPCGASFRDDGHYLASARREADRLVEHLGLTPESSLLDVGSGPGRLPIGILQRVGEIRKYRGVDVSAESVRWGQNHITPEHPSFQFVHIDVENTRYNPGGAAKDSGFTFPFREDEFDIICLYSVFTHMLTDGVRAYLKDFQRILRPDGRIYLTAFLEEGVPDVEENPEGYLGREWKGALHCVRYNEEFFRGLLDENGFRLERFESIGAKERPDARSKGQRGLIISHKD